MQSVCILDRSAWSTGTHQSPCNYLTMRPVSMCKQDAKVELLGTLGCLYTFFFRDKREVVEKSGSAAEG